MKLVAGLGNPGERYRGTRHNVGFEVLDRLSRRHALAWPRYPSWIGDATTNAAQETRWRRQEGDVLLVKPLTFMNLSGKAVAELVRFYKVDLPDLLIVCDDVNLPLGRLRVRGGGSEGGNNGLRSIAEALGTIGYPRLRVGVGRGDLRRDLADHVLTRFESDEQPEMERAIDRAADAVEMWIVDGLPKVMNSFNRAEDRT